MSNITINEPFFDVKNFEIFLFFSIVEMDNWGRLLVSKACFDIVKENDSDPATQIDDSDDEEVIVQAVETEPIDDTNTVGNLISLDEIKSGEIFTQNTSYDFNDG